MPRKNVDGKYILAAGEIGAFAVCPESWRLKMVERVHVPASEQSQMGESLHKEWASRNEELHFFNRWMRLAYAMIATAVVLGLLIASK